MPLRTLPARFELWQLALCFLWLGKMALLVRQDRPVSTFTAARAFEAGEVGQKYPTCRDGRTYPRWMASSAMKYVPCRW